MSETPAAQPLTVVPKKLLPDFLKAEPLVARKEFLKAADIYRRILRKAPSNLTAHINLGAALSEGKDLVGALNAFHNGLRFHPNDEELHCNCGVILRKLRRPQEALDSYMKALDINPKYVQVLENAAVVNMDIGEFQKARELLDRVLEINPTRPGALFTLSLIMLMHGEWHDGWHLYEYRWETADFKTDDLDLVSRRWNKVEDLRDRSLLLVREQGLGDTIQFCRYALLFAQYGAKVTLLVQSQVKSLLSSLNRYRLPHPIEVVAAEEFSEGKMHFDYWIPMMSAPMALIKDYPKVPAINQYLAVDPIEIDEARAQLPQNGKPHIGVVWSGNPEHKNDMHRSMPFEKFVQLLRPDANFHIIQTEINPGEQAQVEERIERGDLVSHQDFLTHFRRTAALLECMDLVIAVDTSVVHLAGALNRPTWVALAYTPDFRWLLQREDSPWYPSVTLIRQQQYNHWEGVIAQIQERLENWMQTRLTHA